MFLPNPVVVKLTWASTFKISKAEAKISFNLYF
jgi:hypothetical protein